ncbi:hgpA, partial [Symbiodinium sp. KB8]
MAPKPQPKGGGKGPPAKDSSAPTTKLEFGYPPALTAALQAISSRATHGLWYAPDVLSGDPTAEQLAQRHANALAKLSKRLLGDMKAKEELTTALSQWAMTLGQHLAQLVPRVQALSHKLDEDLLEACSETEALTTGASISTTERLQQARAALGPIWTAGQEQELFRIAASLRAFGTVADDTAGTLTGGLDSPVRVAAGQLAPGGAMGIPPVAGHMNSAGVGEPRFGMALPTSGTVAGTHPSAPANSSAITAAPIGRWKRRSGPRPDRPSKSPRRDLATPVPWMTSATGRSPEGLARVSQTQIDDEEEMIPEFSAPSSSWFTSWVRLAHFAVSHGEDLIGELSRHEVQDTMLPLCSDGSLGDRTLQLAEDTWARLRAVATAADGSGMAELYTAQQDTLQHLRLCPAALSRARQGLLLSIHMTAGTVLDPYSYAPSTAQEWLYPALLVESKGPFLGFVPQECALAPVQHPGAMPALLSRGDAGPTTLHADQRVFGRLGSVPIPVAFFAVLGMDGSFPQRILQYMVPSSSPATVEDRFAVSAVVPAPTDEDFQAAAAYNSVVISDMGLFYVHAPTYAEHTAIRAAVLSDYRDQHPGLGSLQFLRLLPPLARLPPIQFVASPAGSDDEPTVVDVRPIGGGIVVFSGTRGDTPVDRIHAATRLSGEPIPDQSLVRLITAGHLRVMHREAMVDPNVALTTDPPVALVVSTINGPGDEEGQSNSQASHTIALPVRILSVQIDEVEWVTFHPEQEVRAKVKQASVLPRGRSTLTAVLSDKEALEGALFVSTADAAQTTHFAVSSSHLLGYFARHSPYNTIRVSLWTPFRGPVLFDIHRGSQLSEFDEFLLVSGHDPDRHVLYVAFDSQATSPDIISVPAGDTVWWIVRDGLSRELLRPVSPWYEPPDRLVATINSHGQASTITFSPEVATMRRLPQGARGNTAVAMSRVYGYLTAQGLLLVEVAIGSLTAARELMRSRAPAGAVIALAWLPLIAGMQHQQEMIVRSGQRLDPWNGAARTEPQVMRIWTHTLEAPLTLPYHETPDTNRLCHCVASTRRGVPPTGEFIWTQPRLVQGVAHILHIPRGAYPTLVFWLLHYRARAHVIAAPPGAIDWGSVGQQASEAFGENFFGRGAFSLQYHSGTIGYGTIVNPPHGAILHLIRTVAAPQTSANVWDTSPEPVFASHFDYDICMGPRGEVTLVEGDQREGQRVSDTRREVARSAELGLLRQVNEVCHQLETLTTRLESAGLLPTSTAEEVPVTEAESQAGTTARSAGLRPRFLWALTSLYFLWGPVAVGRDVIPFVAMSLLLQASGDEDSEGSASGPEPPSSPDLEDVHPPTPTASEPPTISAMPILRPSGSSLACTSAPTEGEIAPVQAAFPPELVRVTQRCCNRGALNVTFVTVPTLRHGAFQLDPFETLERVQAGLPHMRYFLPDSGYESILSLVQQATGTWAQGFVLVAPACDDESCLLCPTGTDELVTVVLSAGGRKTAVLVPQRLSWNDLLAYSQRLTGMWGATLHAPPALLIWARWPANHLHLRHGDTFHLEYERDHPVAEGHAPGTFGPLMVLPHRSAWARDFNIGSSGWVYVWDNQGHPDTHQDRYWIHRGSRWIASRCQFVYQGRAVGRKPWIPVPSLGDDYCHFVVQSECFEARVIVQQAFYEPSLECRLLSYTSADVSLPGGLRYRADVEAAAAHGPPRDGDVLIPTSRGSHFSLSWLVPFILVSRHGGFRWVASVVLLSQLAPAMMRVPLEAQQVNPVRVGKYPWRIPLGERVLHESVSSGCTARLWSPFALDAELTDVSPDTNVEEIRLALAGREPAWSVDIVPVWPALWHQTLTFVPSTGEMPLVVIMVVSSEWQLTALIPCRTDLSWLLGHLRQLTPGPMCSVRAPPASCTLGCSVDDAIDWRTGDVVLAFDTHDVPAMFEPPEFTSGLQVRSAACWAHDFITNCELPLVLWAPEWGSVHTRMPPRGRWDAAAQSFIGRFGRRFPGRWVPVPWAYSDDVHLCRRADDPLHCNVILEVGTIEADGCHLNSVCRTLSSRSNRASLAHIMQTAPNRISVLGIAADVPWPLLRDGDIVHQQPAEFGSGTSQTDTSSAPSLTLSLGMGLLLLRLPSNDALLGTAFCVAIAALTLWEELGIAPSLPLLEWGDLQQRSEEGPPINPTLQQLSCYFAAWGAPSWTRLRSSSWFFDLSDACDLQARLHSLWCQYPLQGELPLTLHPTYRLAWASFPQWPGGVPAEILISTDGSSSHAGSCAFIVWCFHGGQWFRLGWFAAALHHLPWSGSPDECHPGPQRSYRSELAALQSAGLWALCALDMWSIQMGSTAHRVTIAVDNLSAMQVAAGWAEAKGPTARRCREIWQAVQPRCQLHYHHVPSHVGVLVNTLADALAEHAHTMASPLGNSTALQSEIDAAFLREGPWLWLIPKATLVGGAPGVIFTVPSSDVSRAAVSAHDSPASATSEAGSPPPPASISSISLKALTANVQSIKVLQQGWDIVCLQEILDFQCPSAPLMHLTPNDPTARPNLELGAHERYPLDRPCVPLAYGAPLLNFKFYVRSAADEWHDSGKPLLAIQKLRWASRRMAERRAVYAAGGYQIEAELEDQFRAQEGGQKVTPAQLQAKLSDWLALPGSFCATALPSLLDMESACRRQAKGQNVLRQYDDFQLGGRAGVPVAYAVAAFRNAWELSSQDGAISPRAAGSAALELLSDPSCIDLPTGDSLRVAAEYSCLGTCKGYMLASSSVPWALKQAWVAGRVLPAAYATIATNIAVSARATAPLTGFFERATRQLAGSWGYGHVLTLPLLTAISGLSAPAHATIVARARLAVQLAARSPPPVRELFDAAWSRGTPWTELLADACRQVAGLLPEIWTDRAPL